MYKHLLLFSAVLFLCCASNAQNENRSYPIQDESIEVAYFASGCFWCVEAIFESVKGVDRVVCDDDIKALNLDHARTGALVVIADAHSCFTYYYWLDDRKAPDFARMVDIHKKPGYDPVEMLLDPKDRLVVLKIIYKLIKKKLGFRTVLNIIPLDAKLVKGSHGRIPDERDDYPILITNNHRSELPENISPTEVFNILESHIRS